MAITGVPNGVIKPSPTKATLAESYIDFADAGANSANWAQQFLPDLMEKEAEIFGNRTIGGFLSQVGAEESMTADQVIWSEQGRLHLSYTSTASGGAATETDLTLGADQDGNAISASNPHGIRIGDMVLLSDGTTSVTAYVTDLGATAATQIDVATYTGANVPANCNVFVFGSEYAKGQQGRAEGLTPNFKSFTNKPIIIKDKFEINGSDTSAIGWVEVSGEDGQSGYLWYLKAEGDTRVRFADYLEMAMIESEKATATISAHRGGSVKGTEGLFAAVKARGNQASGISGINAATDLAEFDAILAEFDKNGAIEENMMFVNRSTALAIDDMLASMNSYGAGGTSYGVFDNDEDMALNLGFSGFRRGSYDFYKSDWKYLNDKVTRGSVLDNSVRGIFIPAGVSSVYDEVLGKNLKRPFLHVRYRASETDNRRMKTWTTGSVGASTSDLDAMEMHYLSERCLVVQGANNFMLLS